MSQDLESATLIASIRGSTLFLPTLNKKIRRRQLEWTMIYHEYHATLVAAAPTSDHVNQTFNQHQHDKTMHEDQ